MKGDHKELQESESDIRSVSDIKDVQLETNKEQQDNHCKTVPDVMLVEDVKLEFQKKEDPPGSKNPSGQK